MNDKDWLIIKTLYEEKNITKTSEALYISQPALSYRLKQIENKLGVVIVFRGKKGVDFTPEGELIASFAKEMVDKLDNLKENISNLKDQISGNLQLGATRAFAFYMLPDLLDEYKEKYPEVNIFLNTDLNINLMQSVLNQNLHLCVVRGHHYWPHVQHIIKKENICIFANQEVRIKDLPKLPMINGTVDYNLKMLIASWWKDSFDRPPLISMKVANNEIARRMVLKNFGYTICPEMLFQDNPNVFKLKLLNREKKEIDWYTYLLYQDDSIKLPAVKAFINVVLNKYPPLIGC